jgi:hypothetical protein
VVRAENEDLVVRATGLFHVLRIVNEERDIEVEVGRPWDRTCDFDVPNGKHELPTTTQRFSVARSESVGGRTRLTLAGEATTATGTFPVSLVVRGGDVALYVRVTVRVRPAPVREHWRRGPPSGRASGG